MQWTRYNLIEFFIVILYFIYFLIVHKLKKTSYSTFYAKSMLLTDVMDNGHTVIIENSKSFLKLFNLLIDSEQKILLYLVW